MTGVGELFIQASEYAPQPQAVAAGQWVRGIPGPGFGFTPPIGGQASCADLIKYSPPSLLEEYQIISYAINCCVFLTNSASYTTAPTITFEIAFLVSGRVHYVATQTISSTLIAAAPAVAPANYQFAGDLVNPIRLGGRDRLGLRIGMMSDQAADTAIGLLVAANIDQDGNAFPVESTITYNVIELPGARRL